MMPRFVQYYYNQYYSMAMRFWNEMSPMQYVGLLIFIAICGWIGMKNASKR